MAAEQRGEAYGWSELFTILNGATPAVDKFLLRQYGVLDLAAVTARAGAIVGHQTQLAQMSVQVKNAFPASFGPDILIKVLARKAEYTITAGTPPVTAVEGAALVKVLTSIVFIQTRATITVI